MKDSLLVKLQVEGHLYGWLEDYFGDLDLRHEKDGNSTLSGEMPDDAAFFGLILKLRDSGQKLLYLHAEKLS